MVDNAHHRCIIAPDLDCLALPHNAAAATIGTSSFAVRWHSVIGPVHGSINHCESQYAPHPHPPEASDVNVTVLQLFVLFVSW